MIVVYTWIDYFLSIFLQISVVIEVRDVVALVERRTDVSSSEDYVNFALDQSNRLVDKISVLFVLHVWLETKDRRLDTLITAVVIICKVTLLPVYMKMINVLEKLTNEPSLSDNYFDSKDSLASKFIHKSDTNIELTYR